MTKPILEVRDLWVGVGPEAACRDITLTVEAGEVVGVLGRAGAGKSQLLRCIGLDFAPSAGAVLLHGVDVTGADGHKRRELRSRSIELVHPPAPEGEPDTTVPGARSGVLLRRPQAPTVGVAGMRQRIQIAKALTHGADILLLDEPFTGVEHRVRLRILELLARLKTEARAGVVVATRHAEVVTLVAGRVVVLDDGQIVQAGPTDEVVRSPSRRRAAHVVERRRSA